MTTSNHDHVLAFINDVDDNTGGELLVDSHIIICDHPETPDAPFNEFPRLTAMTDDELNVVVSTALRSLALHNSPQPVTMFELPDDPPTGMHHEVAEMRRATTRIVSATPVDGDSDSGGGGESIVIRYVEGEPGGPQVLIASTLNDPDHAYHGVVHLRVATGEETTSRLAAFVERVGAVELSAWTALADGAGGWGDQRVAVVDSAVAAATFLDAALAVD